MGRLRTISRICFLLYLSRVVYSIPRRYEPVKIRFRDEQEYEGQLEVLNGGEWRPLCCDELTAEDANVICHTLGYTHGEVYDLGGVDGSGGAGSGSNGSEGGGFELVTDIPSLGCTGNETNIAFCPYTNLGIHYSCDQGIRIRCEGIVKIRLENGKSKREGRVEVFHQGSWGTVCVNTFGMEDANVVCRMLGFAFAERFYGREEFGHGTGKILSDLHCSGDELNIGQCSPSFHGTPNCTHNDDAGVSCVALPVRLVNGKSPNEGRVEVHFNESWGTICDDEWDVESGNVVCRMLGYQGVNRAYGLAYFGEGTGAIVLDNTQCSGTESHIALCASPKYGDHNCEHREDSGVSCLGKATSNIRLVDGPEPSHGRLELNLYGAWGTACRRNWTSIDSTVVCRKLGYFGAADTMYETSSYGKGTGMILLREPRCQGKEADLLQCDVAYPLGVTNCTHDEDVWVSCLQKDELQVRLQGGKYPNEGRVEVLRQGTWGTVCDDNWDILDSHVVCRMLGFKAAHGYSCCGHFGRGSGDILLDEVQCNGTEENLGHCMRQDYGSHDCEHSEDVGVSCLLSNESTMSFLDVQSTPTTEPTKRDYSAVISTVMIGTAVVFFLLFLIAMAGLVYERTRVLHYRRSMKQAQMDLHLQPMSRKGEYSNSYARSFAGSCREHTDTNLDSNRGDSICGKTGDPRGATTKNGHFMHAELAVEGTDEEVEMLSRLAKMEEPPPPELPRREPAQPRPDSPATYESPLDIYEPPSDYEDVLTATYKTNI